MNYGKRTTGKKAINQSYVVRNLHVVPRNSHGVTEDGRWFPQGLPVWEFDIEFYPSCLLYETEHVRAKDGGAAREKVRAKYPDAIRYDF